MEVWDAVRHKCDRDKEKGKFILAESINLRKKEDEEKIHHSGAGRIDKMKMYSMSLYESGDSTGVVSLLDLFNGNVSDCTNKKIELYDLARNESSAVSNSAIIADTCDYITDVNYQLSRNTITDF